MNMPFQNDLVSIIMPSYNSSEFLDEAIQSVLSQTYKKFELIVVDNMSKDESLKIATKYARQDNRVKVFVCNIPGAANARNFGINKSLGRYMAFLDADDIWFKQKLEKQIYHMKKLSVSLSCTYYQPFSGQGDLKSVRIVSNKITYLSLLKTCTVGCSTVMIDRQKHPDILFPQTYKEDYALWLKLTRKGDYFSGISDVLTQYRICDNSLSSNKFREIFRQWNVYRNEENIPLLNACYYLLNYIFYGLKKRG